MWVCVWMWMWVWVRACVLMRVRCWVQSDRLALSLQTWHHWCVSQDMKKSNNCLHQISLHPFMVAKQYRFSLKPWGRWLSASGDDFFCLQQVCVSTSGRQHIWRQQGDSGRGCAYVSLMDSDYDIYCMELTIIEKYTSHMHTSPRSTGMWHNT